MEDCISHVTGRNPSFSIAHLSPGSPSNSRFLSERRFGFRRIRPSSSRGVASDLMFLVELTNGISEGEDVADTYVHTCHMIHDVSSRVRLEISSFSWALILDFLQKMVQFFLSKATDKKVLLGNAARINATTEILEILRKCSLPESAQLVKLLLNIIVLCNADLLSSCYLSDNLPYNVVGGGSKTLKRRNLWECQTTAFTILGEALSKMGSSISVEIWQSTLEVLRKVMDALVSKSLLVEDSTMSRFYSALLHCLHLILSDSKGSLSEHVAGLVAALCIFFIYGLTNRSSLACRDNGYEEKELSSLSIKAGFADSTGSDRGRYRPPSPTEEGGDKYFIVEN